MAVDIVIVRVLVLWYSASEQRSGVQWAHFFIVLQQGSTMLAFTACYCCSNPPAVFVFQLVIFYKIINKLTSEMFYIFECRERTSWIFWLAHRTSNEKTLLVRSVFYYSCYCFRQECLSGDFQNGFRVSWYAPRRQKFRVLNFSA